MAMCKRMRAGFFLLLNLGLGLGLAACGSSQPVNPALRNTQCSSPTPASVLDASITVDIPSDFDPSANPAPSTTIAFSVLLPPRCPGDQFPLILQSHGYGGKRQRTLAADGTLYPDDPHFPSIDKLVRALPYHGYVVISYDERGHGDSTNANARIIDPRAEVQDARRILDWAYDHAAELNIQTVSGSGIAKDLNVGTIGYSYGGGFEMPLAALDARIKTIVPNGTWNNLMYSLLPGDAVKLSFDGLLCLLAATADTSATPNTGVHNTPLVAALCNSVGIQGPQASTLRTRSQLERALALPTTLPRPVAAEEITPFFFSHSTAYFEQQQKLGQPWGYGETQARLRPVSALFLQGNRDTLFNLTDAYWNYQYFRSTGADVRLLTTEGGHMNPLANQFEGSAACGKLAGVEAVLAWFDAKLKGLGSAQFDAIPRVCISVADTPNVPNVPAVAVQLQDVPVGSLSGRGALPTTMSTLSATLPLNASAPVFVPVRSIEVDGAVLAGIPRMSRLLVTPGSGATQEVVAYVGVGIQRGSDAFLVDDEVSGFAEGEHLNNRNAHNDAVLLPGVGEQLQRGDVLGLLFYPQNVQYSAIVSAASVPNATVLAGAVLDTEIPSVASSLDASALTVPNPYTVQIENLELPLLIPGEYPGSRWSR